MHQLFKSVGIALQNIKANPLHTFLSTLGIIIGVASLVAILALGDGLEQTGRAQLANTTSLNILNLSSNAYKVVDEIRIPVEERSRLTIEHARELEEKYKDRALLEMMSRSAATVTYEDSVTSLYLQGNMENEMIMMKDTLFAGRFFNSTDIDDSRKVAVISLALAKRWRDSPEEVIGERFTMLDTEFEIIGIYPESPREAPKASIPITVFTTLNDSYPAITFKVEKAEEIPVIQEEMHTWLDEHFEAGSEAFSVVSNEARIEQFTRGILLFKLVMGAITGISVLVGGIGVMNVLLISVTERTREIGIRKTTGARKKDIIMQFLSESVTISFAGCSLGWVLGMAGLFAFIPVVNSLTNAEFHAVVDAGTAILVLIIAFLIGVIFGTYPAWRASQLNPIDAIRHE